MKKILTPITSAKDIDILNPNIYNTEFFCGYLPLWWIESYNDSLAYSLLGNLSTPINNRNGKNSNVSNAEILREIVRKCDRYNTHLFLVVNAKYYPEYVYPNLKRYIEEVISIGIERLIVCDLGMVCFLQEHYPKLKISISCLNQVTNSWAVKHYLSYKNVERIVFPRHMSSSEIECIVKKYPNMEFEYFIFSNKCLYDDGYCRGVHEFTPICKDNYYVEYYSQNDVPVSDSVIQKCRNNEVQYHGWTRNEIQTKEKGYCTAGFGCMACSLYRLNRYSNIVSVKISIRGHGVGERLRQVQMAHKVLLSVDEAEDIEKIKNIVSTMYGKKSICDDGWACIMI